MDVPYFADMEETVLAVMAVRNRREKTLCAIERLLEDRQAPLILVVDDGSRDDTSQAIAARYPEVTVLQGDGNLYWGGAMNRGIDVFLTSHHSFLLWLNDDVELRPNSVDSALSFAMSREADIVVGSCTGGDGEVTYGGRIRNAWWKPTSFPLVCADEKLDTFNGNFVLYRRRVVEALGRIDTDLRQRMGDFDYGLRATAAGFSLALLPEPVGRCDRNPIEGSILDTHLPRVERFRAMLGIHGMPPRAWWKFCRRHAGWLAPIAFLKPYMNILFKR